MDEQRKAKTPGLVCTCNDLYVEEIKQSLADGESSYKEIFQYHDMMPRCCGCVDHVMSIKKHFLAIELVK